MHMTINNVLKMYDGEFDDFEVYEYTDYRNNHIHTDTIRAIDVESNPSLMDREYKDMDIELMDEEDYNYSVAAGTGMKANFTEWFGNPNAKILVIALPHGSTKQGVNSNMKVNRKKNNIKSNRKINRRPVKAAESYGWIVDENEAWKAYDAACDYWGKDYVDDQIVTGLSTDELAYSLAYMFRMHDFDPLHGEDDYDEDEDIEESRKFSGRKSIKSSKRNTRRPVKAARITTDFSNFKPWSGAVDTWNELEKWDKIDLLEQILDDTYYNEEAGEAVLSETELNDLLWFEPESVYEWVGLYYNDETGEVSDEPFDEDDDYDEDEDIEESTNVHGKKSVTATYGGWGKFYGLDDIEFTVPNDTDDPTIYYNGNYYNYYDIEDTLWSYYKEECAENGTTPDENAFESWVADNSYLVYDTLDIANPKTQPGRGVNRR